MSNGRESPSTPHGEMIHVMPEADLREHVSRTDCWCQPTPDAEEPRVIVHHSMDEREKYETGERMPS